MFRKSKKTKKATRKRPDDQEEDNDQETSTLLQEARQSANPNKKLKTAEGDDDDDKSKALMQQYQAAEGPQVSEKDLATSTPQHHPEAMYQEPKDGDDTAATSADGLFRDKTRNKFLAGPIKASQFVRTTARFDYQPDVCKDYKDTGFCGFGDTCIYLHDRGDFLTGWQLEQQWEEQKKKEAAQRELDLFCNKGDGSADTVADDDPAAQSDGLPFACHICRDDFTNPVVTRCGHYFCESCILTHVRQSEKPTCPICHQDTHGVFNQPTKLISKKRKLVGSKATWQEFAAAQKKTATAES
jgi:RING finger protein 113A